MSQLRKDYSVQCDSCSRNVDNGSGGPIHTLLAFLSVAFWLAYLTSRFYVLEQISQSSKDEPGIAKVRVRPIQKHDWLINW